MNRRSSIMLYFLILLGFLSWTDAIPKCPKVDGRQSVYIPHETDCSKFYQCSNGVPYLFTCPASLHFNPTLNVCDWPSAAGCQTGTTSAPTTSEPDSTEDPDEPSDSSSSSSESESSSSSESKSGEDDPSENDSGEIIALRLQAQCSDMEKVYLTPHPRTHEKYVRCYYGDPIIKQCLTGFAYNGDIQICVKKTH